MRSLLVLAALATLTACGGGDSDRGSRDDRESSRSERDGNREDDRGGRDRDRDSAADEEPRREVDSELAEELRQEVRTSRETLPTTEGALTITDVDLDGTEIIYTGRVAGDINRSSLVDFRRTVSRSLCTGTTAEVIRRGGAFTYSLRDQDDEDYEVTIDSCD